MESELTQPKTRRESEVWQACDDLWSRTSSVRHLTGDNIRDHLLKLGYKRGSPNEIYRYRNSWKDSRGIGDFDSDTENEVKTTDPISRAVSLVYDQMRSQTNDTLAELKEKHESQLTEMTTLLESTNQKAVDLENHNRDLEERLAQATKLIASLNAEQEELQKQTMLLTEKVRTEEEKHDATTKAHADLILEMKTFHEREIDIWREKNKEVKEASERQGAIFSEELMTLKTMLRQANEEKEMAKAKNVAMEESLKEARLSQQYIASTIQSQLADISDKIDAKRKSQNTRLQAFKRDLMLASKSRKPHRDSRKYK